MGNCASCAGPSAPADWFGSTSVANLAGVMQRLGRFPQLSRAARTRQIASGGRQWARRRAPVVSPSAPLRPGPFKNHGGPAPGGCLSSSPASAPGRVTATPGSTDSLPGPVQDTSRRRALGGVNDRLWGFVREHELWRSVRGTSAFRTGASRCWRA